MTSTLAGFHHQSPVFEDHDMPLEALGEVGFLFSPLKNERCNRGERVLHHARRFLVFPGPLRGCCG